jgi:hypothetical protein
MWSTRSHVLSLIIHSTAVLGYNYGTVNSDADPYVIAMVNNASVGPDGTSSPASTQTHRLMEVNQQGHGGISRSRWISRTSHLQHPCENFH